MTKKLFKTDDEILEQARKIEEKKIQQDVEDMDKVELFNTFWYAYILDASKYYLKKTGKFIDITTLKHNMSQVHWFTHTWWTKEQKALFNDVMLSIPNYDWVSFWVEDIDWY